MSKTMQSALLAFVGLIVKIMFLIYSAATNLIVLAIMLGWTIYVLSQGPAMYDNWWYGAPSCLAIGLLYSFSRTGPPKDNPYRKYCGLTGKIDSCADAFIAWIGKIKYFTSPLSLAEDAGSYRITGKEIRELIDRELQPGDILLRGFDGYLDGIMIGMTGGGEGLGKYFSHAALYVGRLNDATDKPIVARRLQTQDDDSGKWRPATEGEKNAIRNDQRYYEEGRQSVVHSMTRGVFVEDILTFLRCDYLAVLRLPDQITLSREDIESDASLIRELPDDAEEIRARLMKGESVRKDNVIEIARLSALGKIGSCYDFQFNDIKTANRFSCSEFVYYCFKSIHCYIGLKPKTHAFMKVLFRKHTITPADIYDAAVNKRKLEIAWMSASLKQHQRVASPSQVPAIK